jgi:exodeoxyribonuclease-3
LRLATLNVNSIRKRVPHVQRFLESTKPDLLFLQELKCKTEEFPAAEFESRGYRTHAVGQHGGRNGVAVLARIPFEVVAEALPGEAEDTHARYIEVAAAGGRFAGIYLPNGNSGGAEGYAYKLRWMERLRQVAAERLDSFTPSSATSMSARRRWTSPQAPCPRPMPWCARKVGPPSGR